MAIVTTEFMGLYAPFMLYLLNATILLAYPLVGRKKRAPHCLGCYWGYAGFYKTTNIHFQRLGLGKNPLWLSEGYGAGALLDDNNDFRREAGGWRVFAGLS